jgi:uncharacterized membrane protein YfcA
LRVATGKTAKRRKDLIAGGTSHRETACARREMSQELRQMDLLSYLQFPFVVSGLGVGFIVGMTGVGGGALMTPLLVLVFGIHPASAVGTDLLFASATKGFGTLVHGIGGSIDWRIVGLLGCGSVPASIVTTLVLHSLDVHSAETALLITKILACALILTALSLIFRRGIQRLTAGSALRLSPQRQGAITLVFGALLGVLVTTTSIGAGAIGVTVLLMLYPQVPTHRIVGSDIAHAVPLTFVAGIGHLGIGTVDIGLLASLLAGSVPGVIAGSLVAPRMPDAALRIALAAVLIAVSVLLLLK